MRTGAISTTIAMALAGVVLAQPAPMDRKIGGIFVGDMSLDAIYITRDLNGDGDALDPGEATVFFDATNASGLPAPTGSVYSIFQACDGRVFYGDGGSDAVYWLVDSNGDRDALDAGEAGVWFSAAGNAAGYPLLTPNGVWQDDDGAVYVTNAGTLTTPCDAVYRTIDLNLDGDAEDPGEATLWCDLETLIADSTPFEIVLMGGAAYITDLQGGNPDTIMRAEDSNGNGVIEAAELTVFLDEYSPFVNGVGANLCCNETSLYSCESSSTAYQVIHRLTDLNGNGMIDQASEAVEVWNDTLVPFGYEMGSSWTLAIGPGGQLALGSSGTDVRDNVSVLIDGNGDGDFLDTGETTVWADGGGGSGIFIDSPRSVEYALPKPGDVNGDEVVNVEDLLALLAVWGPCPGCPADFNCDGEVNVVDLLTLLANWS